MSLSFKHIALVGRPDDRRVIEPMTLLAEHLKDTAVSVYGNVDIPHVIHADDAELGKRADLIVAVGGDGTMLYAGAIARERDVPVLGVNRGRLGFLADVTPDEILPSIDSVLSGNYSRESRLLLKAVLTSGEQETIAYAVNDVVLQRRKTGRMVDFETRVADRYINTHSGDGLIVATPTGSTAYALSCGGPIIDPRLDALVLVPVAPHTLTDRPIVIPASEAVEVRVLPRDDTTAELTVDGQEQGEIIPGDRVTIGPSDQRLSLVHPPGYDYFEILRSKLYWGKDGRNRGTPGGT